MNVIKTRPATSSGLQLEPLAQTFVDSLAELDGPPLYTLTPTEARAVLDQLQSGPVTMAAAEVEEHMIPGGPAGDVSVTIVKPSDSNGSLPAVVYAHGGGWVLGNFSTHERLVRDLTMQSGAAFVFVNYSRSPEARFPHALEQIYATIEWVADHGEELGLDRNRVAIAGDSVGGNMAAAITLLAQQRDGPSIRYQALLYPVTDAGFDTASYEQFADGPWLTRMAMQWFWDAYHPDLTRRDEPTASPLSATKAQLSDLPPALIITDEADVLRDEGEAYALKLRQAGVEVTATRYNGVFHDFMMLNDLATANATREATTQVALALKNALRA